VDPAMLVGIRRCLIAGQMLKVVVIADVAMLRP